MSKLIINKNVRKGKIDKNIYGHFSEHLGRCIYGGLYLNGDFILVNGAIAGNVSADNGGGVFVSDTAAGTIELRGGTIGGNTLGTATPVASTANGNYGQFGGGIYADGLSTPVTFSASPQSTTVIKGNAGYYEGGGMNSLKLWAN